MNTNINNRRLHSRRGVAPIIATLLLVAIAVVGGAIVFAYSQNFFSSSQISGKPNIESLKVIGYDGRDIATGLSDHNGIAMALSAGAADNKSTTPTFRIIQGIENITSQIERILENNTDIFYLITTLEDVSKLYHTTIPEKVKQTERNGGTVRLVVDEIPDKMKLFIKRFGASKVRIGNCHQREESQSQSHAH
jgi:flagellin-like protein